MTALRLPGRGRDLPAGQDHHDATGERRRSRTSGAGTSTEHRTRGSADVVTPYAKPVLKRSMRKAPRLGPEANARPKNAVDLLRAVLEEVEAPVEQLERMGIA